MYDFCLTYPYAFLLALGGLIGFLAKGSLPSLLGGVGSATVLGIAAQISLNHYHQARSWTETIIKPSSRACQSAYHTETEDVRTL